jgi:hypothetical protein
MLFSTFWSSEFWSTQKTFPTFWFRCSDQLKRPFRRSEIFGLSTFWSSTFRPPPNSTYVRLARIWVLVKLSFYEEISTQTDYSNKLFQIKLKLKIFLKTLSYLLSRNLTRIWNSKRNEHFQMGIDFTRFVKHKYTLHIIGLGF